MKNSPADPQASGSFPHDPLDNMTLRADARHPNVGKFGYTRDGGNRFHSGVDISGSVGDPVYAVDSGTVSRVGFDGKGYGNYIVIDHSKVSTIYGHLSTISPDVAVGSRIGGGSIIGYVGRTGNVTGNIPTHLHFGVLNSGSSLSGAIWHNPENFLRSR